MKPGAWCMLLPASLPGWPARCTRSTQLQLAVTDDAESSNELPDPCRVPRRLSLTLCSTHLHRKSSAKVESPRRQFSKDRQARAGLGLGATGQARVLEAPSFLIVSCSGTLKSCHLSVRCACTSGSAPMASARRGSSSESAKTRFVEPARPEPVPCRMSPSRHNGAALSSASRKLSSFLGCSKALGTITMAVLRVRRSCIRYIWQQPVATWSSCAPCCWLAQMRNSASSCNVFVSDFMETPGAG